MPFSLRARIPESNMNFTNSDPSIQRIGYCLQDEPTLRKIYQQKGADGLTNLEGEYTLIVTEGDDCTIITSPVGAMHYFYTVQHGRFFHGEQISTILKQSGLPWQWNWPALGDLCQLENLTGNATLPPAIHRVPPGSILQFCDGSISLKSTTYIDTITPRPPDPDEALEALNEAVATWAGPNPYLSLSGGFDSRVILSSMLKLGIKPHLITMGSSEATDVQVARRIAAKFGLQHDLISLRLEDFFTHAPTISAITNGTKTAWHWHTYLYPLKAVIPSEASFFVGTLGEFARSYYFDRGKLGNLAALAPVAALRKFWNLKLDRHPTFEADERAGLAPEFASQLNDRGRTQRAEKLTGYCHGQFLPGLTRYYFEQRVPNFYANGIRMYRASSHWRSPFHSRRWIDAIWNLPSSWKLGSNWHRYAIRSNCPELLAFPEENGFDRRRMLPKAPPLYWTPPMRRERYVSYDLSAEWYRDRRLQDFIQTNKNSIADIVDPSLVERILKTHSSGTDRTRSLAFLLTMIHWKHVLGYSS